MKFKLLLVITAIVLLTSCEDSSKPTITVKVENNFSGMIHLIPCTKDADGPLVIDINGNGATSVCPKGNVILRVIKNNVETELDEDSIKIDRTGDGIPVLISAAVK